MAPTLTSNNWRRGIAQQDYATLSEAYNAFTFYNVTDGIQALQLREFRDQQNVPVAYDDTTGLLVPPWAFDANAAGVAGFAARFLGFADGNFNGRRRKVPVITDGGSFEMYLATPGEYKPHTWFTLDGTLNGKLHPYRVVATTDPNLALFYNKEHIAGDACRSTVELNVLSRTKPNLPGVPGGVVAAAPAGP